MGIMKQIPALMSEVITTIFNRILKEKKFPKALKAARVLPLRKPKKCRLDGRSYCPISILNPIEKLIEEEFKEQLTEYFEERHIIPDQHHGGRAGHSTMSAKAMLDKVNADTVEEKENVAILTTDLSQAFDLVDHQLLEEKLKFHGVGKATREIIRSFLANREYFVEVQGARSAIKKLKGCS